MEKKGVYLRWEDVNYNVKLKQGKEVKILKGVSGQAKPGELIAVMGPSGSGKTSLINVLSKRRTVGVTGSIKVNGAEPGVSFKHHMGYVTQHAQFFSSVRVKETLLYTAALRLNIPRQAREKRVAEVIDQFDLNKCANSKVGNDAQGGISGGERRRLSIAAETLHRPALLLADEPTSGLDAASAQRLVLALRTMADKSNTTVICSIHQPRTSLLPIFDTVMLMAEGSLIYSGPTWAVGQEPSQGPLVRYFADAGYPCPNFENPADYMLDLVNTRVDGVDGEETALSEGTTGAVEMEDRQAVVAKLTRVFAASELQAAALEPPASIPPPLSSSVGSDGLCGGCSIFGSQRYPTSWFVQFWTLLKRTFVYKLREPAAVATQGLNSVILPLVVGSIYFQQGTEITDVNDKVASISFIMVMQTFMAIDQLLLFPFERSVYLHEQSSGMYSTSAFYWGRTLAELPFHILFALVAGLVSALMYGLQDDATKLLNFLVCITLLTLCGAAFLTAVGSVSKTLEQSNALGTVILVMFMLFDGFYINKDNIPSYYEWLNKLSFIGYGVEAGVVNEFRGLNFTCPNPPTPGCTPLTGEQALALRGLDEVDFLDNMWALFGMMLAYRFIAYFGLRFMWTGQTFRERLAAG